MTTRKTQASERWWNNPHCRTFFEYAAWVFVIEVAIVVCWVVPFEDEGPVWEIALILGLLFLLFALPAALVAGSGSLMRFAIPHRPTPAIETTEGESRPQFYWPWEHCLQALLSAAAATAMAYLGIIDGPRLPPYWIAFPWCVEGLTLLGILGLRTSAFALCFQPSPIGAWAAATWASGAWDRLSDLLIAASLSFLIVTCATMTLFVGSSDEFPEFCAWVMVLSLVPIGFMLTGRGSWLAWRRLRKERQTIHVV